MVAAVCVPNQFLPAKYHSIKSYEHLTKIYASMDALLPTDFALSLFFYRLFNYRRYLTSPEQLWKPQGLKTCFGYFQDRFSTMGDNLSGNVNQSSAHCAGIGTDRHDRRTHIFLEGFKQKMTDQHRIIPRGVGIKLFERELFMAKVPSRPGWPIHRCHVHDNRQSVRWSSNNQLLRYF